MACDAGLLIVEEDEAGNVLNIGRKSRIIPPAMARALAIRDNGCQFPGCCETRYTEGHHIKHWADGGETKLDNLVTLCRYHHRELHKGSFYLTLKPAATNTDTTTAKQPHTLCTTPMLFKSRKILESPLQPKSRHNNSQQPSRIYLRTLPRIRTNRRPKRLTKTSNSKRHSSNNQ